MLADADYLVGVRVTIVTNGWRLCVTWLRIDHNGVGVYTLYLPLILQIKIASYLSSFLYYILIYNLSFIYYHH